MPSSKDFCPVCEDLRPLLNQHRGWRNDPANKVHLHGGPVLSKEDALTVLRFIKHWPTNNSHFAGAHVNCFARCPDDIDTLHGLTLSFVQLGIQYTRDVERRYYRRMDAGQNADRTEDGDSGEEEDLEGEMNGEMEGENGNGDTAHDEE